MLIILYSILSSVILSLFLEILGFSLFICQMWQFFGILIESNSISMYGSLSEIFSIVYLVFQIYTLSFHKDTVNLFKNPVKIYVLGADLENLSNFNRITIIITCF